MKRILIAGMVLAAVCPLFSQEFGGRYEAYYNMETPHADDAETHSFYFIEGKFSVEKEFEPDISGRLVLKYEAEDHGRDSTGEIGVEEMWLKLKEPFNVKGLGFTFGQMQVPFNLDYDASPANHSYTNKKALISQGVGEIDETLGFSAGYFLGSEKGTISLTTMQYTAGIDSDGKDLDTGLFNSMVLQWDTGKKDSVFGVKGLRIVAAYAMLAAPEWAYEGTAGAAGPDEGTAGSIISLGAVYKMEMGLATGLEIDISSNAAQNRALDVDGDTDTDDFFFMDQEGGTLIAFDLDYDFGNGWNAGLTYEMFTYGEIDDLGGSGLEVVSSTDTRYALRCDRDIAKKTRFFAEYWDSSNDEFDQLGSSMITLGIEGKF